MYHQSEVYLFGAIKNKIVSNTDHSHQCLLEIGRGGGVTTTEGPVFMCLSRLWVNFDILLRLGMGHDGL